MMLQLNPRGQSPNRLSTYHSTRLLTNEWMQPRNGSHEIFPVAIEPTDTRVASAVTAYAVRRPDNQWAILAINKDPRRAARLDVRFKLSETRPPITFSGKIDIVQFSRREYAWRDDGPNGRP